MSKLHHGNFVANRSIAIKFEEIRRFVPLIFLFVLSMMVSVGAWAQQPSADTAIEVARQWLSLADKEQSGQMWDQSDALLKQKLDRNAWIGYVANVRSQLGSSPNHRIWQAMAHQVDGPNLPHGEFASVTFASFYIKRSAWERVSLVWSNGHWTPVGYQSGAIEAAVN